MLLKEDDTPYFSIQYLKSMISYNALSWRRHIKGRKLQVFPIDSVLLPWIQSLLS